VSYLQQCNTCTQQSEPLHDYNDSSIASPNTQIPSLRENGFFMFVSPSVSCSRHYAQCGPQPYQLQIQHMRASSSRRLEAHRGLPSFGSKWLQHIGFTRFVADHRMFIVFWRMRFRCQRAAIFSNVSVWFEGTSVSWRRRRCSHRHKLTVTFVFGCYRYGNDLICKLVCGLT
jgi:hypothetical protein